MLCWLAAKMLKVHRVAARKEVETLLMGTRSASTYDMNWLAWEMFKIKDHKKRVLDVDSKAMELVVAQARGGEVLFESNSSERTMLKDASTAAQKELWRFFG